MLNALKQIELRHPPAPDSTAHVERDDGKNGSASPEAGARVAGKRQLPPEETAELPRDQAAMESLLVDTEAAAAEALDPVLAEPWTVDSGWESLVGSGVCESDDAEDDALELGAGEVLSQNAAAVVEDSEKIARSRPHDVPNSLGELAAIVLGNLESGRTASLLFVSPNSDTLGADLLVPLSMPLAQQLGEGLLLIDTNLRRPVLAGRLGVEASRGLTDVIRGTARWHEVVRRTVIPGAELLPAVPFSTPAGPPPSRLNLERLLAEAQQRYRLLLIHAASLQHPEVAPLAGYCTGVYLVVRVHATTQRAVREAGAILKKAGANLIGCVVIR